MELMRKAKDLDPELPVILITGFAEVRGAVEALRAGAHDYLAKPFEHQQVIRVVLRALNERRLKLELKHLADHVHQVLSPRETFGPSEAIGKVIAAIERVANSNFSVLIVGETGSGKEVVARAIHQASGRARQPFVPVDCGAVPETLLRERVVRARAGGVHRGGSADRGKDRGGAHGDALSGRNLQYAAGLSSQAAARAPGEDPVPAGRRQADPGGRPDADRQRPRPGSDFAIAARSVPTFTSG